MPLLKASSEYARLETGRRAVTRSSDLGALKPSDHVRSKHFPENMVSSKYYAESNGRVLMDAPKRPVLSVNAVPCIFPGCPKYSRGNKSLGSHLRDDSPLQVTGQSHEKSCFL